MWTSSGSGLLRHGLNFSRVWCTMRLISGKKRLEACRPIHAEGGHLEHLLLQGACCLHEVPVATYQNRFFSEPPTTTHNWLYSEPPTFEF